MKKDEFSPCGLVCSDCEWYNGEKEPKCPGCTSVEGKPFWGTCLTYACVKEHNVEHCGYCAEFPCKEFMTRFDPSEGPENALKRAGLLAYRVKHGDEAAVDLLRKAEEYEAPEH